MRGSGVDGTDRWMDGCKERTAAWLEVNERDISQCTAEI